MNRPQIRLGRLLARITGKTPPARILADQARDRRDWATAAALYKSHLDTFPDDDAIGLQLGHALKEAGRYGDAAAAYQAVIDHRPNHADALLSLGHAYKLMGDPAAAVACYEQSAAIDGNPHAMGELDQLGPYRHWFEKFQLPQPADYQKIAAVTAALTYRPSFSFVMPVYNPPVDYLRRCIDSMLAQTYGDFELCIADDHSPNPAIAALIADYAARDARVKFVIRDTNGHISAASNDAIALASGEFIVLVDHDDLVPDYALFVVAWYLNRYPQADVIYSDEDKIDEEDAHSAPYFKGDFNKYLMYGHNMVSHLGVYRRSLVTAIGGFRVGFEGSQDYDLFLRCLEQSRTDRIIHIPHVLYHWRMIPGSTAVSADQKSYAITAAQRAINDHFDRTGLPLRSCDWMAAGCSGVDPVGDSDRSVSIIIPTRNGLDVLRPCITSIERTQPKNVEILIVDNGSDDRATRAHLADLAARGVARIIRYPGPFNFSLINNLAAEQATGDILCLLNNDTEVCAADWLQRARVLLSIPEIGVVGARLLYPDQTLQHFGLVLGMGKQGVAGTPHGGIQPHDPGHFGKARLLQEFSAVTAACMFVRKEDYLRVGGFESELKVAYNDVDFCLKIRALGLRVVADPEIVLIHKESKTRGSDREGARARRLAKEAAWMKRQWAEQIANDPYYSPNHSLLRDDFARAVPPRVPMPWQQ